MFCALLVLISYFCVFAHDCCFPILGVVVMRFFVSKTGGDTMTETKSPDLFGRRVLKSSVRVITPENVLDVLERARYDHEKNRSELEYLWKYYKGEQPILRRTKKKRFWRKDRRLFMKSGAEKRLSQR